jgi:hypothetical protein
LEVRGGGKEEDIEILEGRDKLSNKWKGAALSLSFLYFKDGKGLACVISTAVDVKELWFRFDG